MSERFSTNDRVEAALRELAVDIELPDAPDLGPAVRAEISAGRPRRAWVPAWERLRIVWAVAVLVVGVALVLTVSPAARRAVADWLGISGVRIERDEGRPSRLPTVSPDLGLGTAVSLDAARAEVDFDVVVPDVPGADDADFVYLDEMVPGGKVSLVYGARPGLPEIDGSNVGLVVSEFRGDLDETFVKKSVFPGGEVEPVEVGTALGFWLTGRQHGVMYLDATGEPREDTLRAAGNTLLFERASLAVRIEADISKARALEIGRSLFD